MGLELPVETLSKVTLDEDNKTMTYVGIKGSRVVFIFRTCWNGLSLTKEEMTCLLLTMNVNSVGRGLFHIKN